MPAALSTFVLLQLKAGHVPKEGLDRIKRITVVIFVLSQVKSIIRAYAYALMAVELGRARGGRALRREAP